MKVTVAQLNPRVGDIQGNSAKALSALEQGQADGSDLVVLPELFLMGYPPQDLLEKGWFVERQKTALWQLADHTRRRPATGLICGTALPTGRTEGRGLYNTAVLIRDGNIIFKQAKSLLPTYDIFDERRYFDPAVEIETYRDPAGTLGLSVCEDAWNEEEFWAGRRMYDINPIETLARQGAEFFINVSASPFYAGKDVLRYRLVHHHASRYGVPFVFVNQVGGNDEVVFDGRSMCLDAQGRPIWLGPAFEECVVTVDMDQPDRVEFEPQEEIESVLQALILGIRDYLTKSGLSKAVVGLSGGIDSAVTAAVAVRALGRENVLGVTMPSMHSSRGSVDDSVELAANLGIEIKTVPIKGIYDAYIDTLQDHFDRRPPDVTEENIQARIRGNILMALSNKFGHVVLATGNKSELAMGYCTLYGDMSGGLAVISDLPKMMVYSLARHMNRNGEIIPRAILEKAPSAELRPDQKDEDSLPPYHLLDRILNLYVEEGHSGEEIAQMGFDREIVNQVVRTINRNEYKRKQAPPGIKVTSKAFGMGRRMPLAALYDE